MNRIVIAAALVWMTALAAAGPVTEEAVKKISAALPAKATAKPTRPRKMLIYSRCSGHSHGAIPLGRKMLELMGAKTGAFEAVVSDDDRLLTAAKLKAFDAVCINNATTRWEKDGPEMTALRKFVEGGKGLVGIHAATDGTAGHLFGGLFSGHPWNQKVGVKNDDPAHPLNAAFAGKGFDVADEIYQFTKIYSRTKLRVLLSLDMAKVKKKGGRADGDYAVSWVRPLGKGRVFYCSLGHRNEIFWNPAVLRHYLDGIQFALGDLKADTAPSGGKDGWIDLFNGKDFTGWTLRKGSWVVEGAAMARKGGGSVWTKQRYGDFVLDLQFKVAKGTNSGIFIRTGSIRNSVQTGIEIQVLDSAGKAKVGKHDCGALYDLLAPSKNTTKPPDEWNHAVITCKGPKIKITLNGQQIVDADLDRWTTPRKNPDGSRNKFAKALKDFPREGHIGFQDHGNPVWYRNVRIKPLK